MSKLGLNADDFKKIEREVATYKDLSLEKQCAKMNIPLNNYEVSKIGNKPELTAKKILLKNNDFDEIYFIENRFPLIFQLLVYDFTGQDFYDYAFEEEYYDDLIKRIENSSLQTLKNNISLLEKDQEEAHIIYEDDDFKIELGEKAQNYKGWWDIREKNLWMNLFGAIDKNKLVKAAKVYFAENSFYTGWPDLLAIIKRTGIKFYEVKTTDNLQLNQLFMFRCFGDDVGLRFEVVQLIEKNKEG